MNQQEQNQGQQNLNQNNNPGQQGQQGRDSFDKNQQKFGADKAKEKGSEQYAPNKKNEDEQSDSDSVSE